MNATTTHTDMTVANTIFAQLGGPRFSAMTGCKNLMGDASSLTFAIGRGAKDGINRVRVTLDADDTYTVSFYRIGRAPSFKVAVVAEVSGVYSDSLRTVFTARTGFCTNL